MHFPVSGLDVHPLIPFFTAFGVSFFTFMGGVSGAFLLLPFQVSVLGYSAPSVSATNHVFNIVAIPSGVYRYIREGRMLWAPDLGGYRRDSARRFHRGLGAHRIPSGSQTFQGVCRFCSFLHRLETAFRNR
jgi:hypothetical protein